MRGAILLAAVVGLVAAAPTHTSPKLLQLPPPVFKTTGWPAVVAASGPTVALGTVNSTSCPIRLFRFDRAAPPVLLKKPNPCNRESDAFVDELWLARTTIGAQLYDSPSPHGEAFTFMTGPRPAGPLRDRGDTWGWTDSEEPYGYGCAWVVAAGGGVIAAAKTPHRLGYDHGLQQENAACPAGAATEIELWGASESRVSVPGTWAPLATDGKRILLTGLDQNGQRTGTLSLVDLRGKRLAAPAVDTAVARRAFEVWLAPEGLVLETPSGIAGPRWSVKQDGDVAVGQGRVLYVSKRTLHVRRIRDGADRTLLVLPPGRVDLAAGSFGVAIAIWTEEKAALYRLRWRTIDLTLRA